MPNANSTGYHEGIYDAGIKFLSNLLPNIKCLNLDLKQFKLANERLSRTF
jgi:hypothetical protein